MTSSCFYYLPYLLIYLSDTVLQNVVVVPWCIFYWRTKHLVAFGNTDKHRVPWQERRAEKSRRREIFTLTTLCGVKLKLEICAVGYALCLPDLSYCKSITKNTNTLYSVLVRGGVID